MTQLDLTEKMRLSEAAVRSYELGGSGLGYLQPISCTDTLIKAREQDLIGRTVLSRILRKLKQPPNARRHDQLERV